MNGNSERKKRAYLQFLAWAQEYSPEWHAAIVERFPPDIVPPAGGLNQLGEAWDMFYPSKYYGGTGYRGRYHTAGEHLSGLGQDPGWLPEYGGQTTAPTTSGNGFNWEETLDKAFDFATKAVPAYFTYETQRDIAEINLERAKQGLPPLDPGATATQIRVVHDVPPEMQNTISQFKLGGINILLWGGLAVAGFFVIRAMR